MGLISILFVLGSFQAPHADLCTLLAPSDVSSLLGGPQQPKPIADFGCTWAGTSPTHKLASIVITVPPMTPDQSKSAFDDNKSRQMQDPKRHARAEAGLGDQAFSGLSPYGIIIEILKHGQLLKVQYNTNTRGTESQRDSVVALAKKAAGKF
jgi:hypothetical protein